MKKLIVLLVAVFILFVTVTVSMYFINPYGTATPDPRGRIMGFMSFSMQSSSMVPGLNRGDRIFVDTTAYMDSEPALNDVIVFRYPPAPEQVYVKRVVGRAGERVRISGGQVYVDGEPLAQPYVDLANSRSPYSQKWGEIIVPQGMLFVLGDNRDNSNDSRVWGFVPRENVVGRVSFTFGAGQAD